MALQQTPDLKPSLRKKVTIVMNILDLQKRKDISKPLTKEKEP
jgi:hypothetical protein